MLIGIITGLIGWINQAYVKEEWRWVSTEGLLPLRIFGLTCLRRSRASSQAKDSFRECSPAQGKDYCPEMVVVPAGSFMMGSPDREGPTITKARSIKSPSRNPSPYPNLH